MVAGAREDGIDDAAVIGSEIESGPGARARRGRILVALAVALVALLIAGLWSQRKPIATGFVDRALAARGVPARYKITRLGVYQQRLEQISIGDPARPDLTADWAVLNLSMGVGGPSLRSVRAGGVRLRGRLIDGRVTLGTLDKLLPARTGAPFALPDLDVTLSDARMRLDTPAGPLGLALDGRGNLSDGFRGTLAIASRTLALAGCRSEGASAFLHLAIAERRTAFDGPVRAARVRCGAVAADAPAVMVDARLSAALDAWDGGARIEAAALSAGARRLEGVRGRIGIAGTAKGSSGEVTLAAGRALADGVVARQARFEGRYVVAPGAARAGGRLAIAQGSIAEPQLRALAAGLAIGGGTPLGPLGEALARAVTAAGRDWRLDADLIASVRGGAGAVQLDRLALTAASGARATAEGGMLGYAWPSGRARLDGRVTFGGGGLPEGRIALAQAGVGAPITGEAVVAPFAAGGARLALSPVRFARAGDATRIATTIRLDGPIADGRIEGLTLPLDGRLGPGGLRVNEACAPLAFERLAIAGLVTGATRLTLCPEGGALLRGDSGGGTIAQLRLAGRMGGAPATIGAARLCFALARPGFVAETVSVRLGDAPQLTRLDLARLDGLFTASGLTGRYAGLSGQIGGVPLILSEGAGPWRLAGAALQLSGRLQVADEADPPRFYPLRANDVALRLADGRIRATGTLRDPRTAAAVSKVTIAHDLARGAGRAVLDVPALMFNDDLQPEQLTRLTLGVIANVRGTVRGAGTIEWSPAGVRSVGSFATDGLDIAAAFGPVRGLKGRIEFIDLLGLVSAPGQLATIVEANPGIAVNDGVIRYRLLAGQKVAIESGRWPFSGGELLLEPTTMDLGQPADRRMTFRVVGMDAAKFVEQFEFKNIAVTGIFDGTIPIIFGATGGRIEHGRLAVRAGGGTLAYVGEVSNADLGTYGSLAFDALKRMRYRRLGIDLNGSLDGEIVSRVLFDGTNETPKEAIKRNGLLSRFANLPFRFTITVRAPFRGLLNAARSFNDPRGLIEQARARPEAAAPADFPVQPR